MREIGCHEPNRELARISFTLRILHYSMQLEGIGYTFHTLEVELQSVGPSGDGWNLRDYCSRPHHSKRFQTTLRQCRECIVLLRQLPRSTSAAQCIGA